MGEETNDPQNVRGGAQYPSDQTAFNQSSAATQEDKTSSESRAPWETGRPDDPPRAPDGVRYAAYQDAPSVNSPLVSHPVSVIARPIEDYDLEEKPLSRRTAGLIAAGLVALLLAGFLVYEFLPSSTAAPARFTTYRSPDGRFMCDVPANWSKKSHSSGNGMNNAVGEAAFKKGAAKIEFTSDTVSDLRSAVLASSGSLPNEFTQDPTTVLHTVDRSRAASAMKNYTEMPMQEMQTGFGPAEVSEFTGKGGFLGLGGPMHGYRASVSDGTVTLEAVLECPQKRWRILSPSFQHIIESIAPAQDGVFSPLAGASGTKSTSPFSSDAAPAAGQSSILTSGNGSGNTGDDSSSNSDSSGDSSQ